MSPFKNLHNNSISPDRTDRAYRANRTDRTKLRFKLDFPCNLCGAAFAIVAMFSTTPYCLSPLTVINTTGTPFFSHYLYLAPLLAYLWRSEGALGDAVTAVEHCVAKEARAAVRNFKTQKLLLFQSIPNHRAQKIKAPRLITAWVREAPF